MLIFFSVEIAFNGLATTLALLLDWRTRDAAIRAKYTTIASLRLE